MNRLDDLRAFVADIEGGLHRSFPFVVEELRDSGDRNSLFNMRGYAAVYGSWSLDLGGFRERILPGAFDNVLASDSHVLHTWDHDTSKVLSTTKNGTLTLGSDTHGLQFYSRVAKTGYAADLKNLVERKDVDEASFAFNVSESGDEWRMVEEDGRTIVERDVHDVSFLADVTTCAMGAYPATTSALALRSRLAAVSGPDKRADMESVLCLTQMYELGQAFLEDEDQPSDAGDRAAMQQILTSITGLIESEASEPDDEGSEMEGRLREAGATESRADKSAGSAKGEVARLRREADSAAAIARERLYRRVS